MPMPSHPRRSITIAALVLLVWIAYNYAHNAQEKPKYGDVIEYLKNATKTLRNLTFDEMSQVTEMSQILMSCFIIVLEPHHPFC
jgi:hypothetical protein